MIPPSLGIFIPKLIHFRFLLLSFCIYTNVMFFDLFLLLNKDYLLVNTFDILGGILSLIVFVCLLYLGFSIFFVSTFNFVFVNFMYFHSNASYIFVLFYYFTNCHFKGLVCTKFYIFIIICSYFIICDNKK